MTNKPGIAVLLVISIMVNGLLGYSAYMYQIQNNTLTQHVLNKQTRINELITDYNNVAVRIGAQNELIQQLQREVKVNNSEINDYRDRLAKADYFVSRAKCPVMVDELKAYAATTNADIKKSIMQALESSYDGRITSANFTTYWDNSKSAMLTSSWGGTGTTKTIVAWRYDDSAIQTIFDVNRGCVMYTGDR